jgi:hypothetical protein
VEEVNFLTLCESSFVTEISMILFSSLECQASYYSTHQGHLSQFSPRGENLEGEPADGWLSQTVMCTVPLSIFFVSHNDVLLSIPAAKGTARKLTVQELVTTVHGSVSCDLVMEGNND